MKPIAEVLLWIVLASAAPVLDAVLIGGAVWLLVVVWNNRAIGTLDAGAEPARPPTIRPSAEVNA